MGEGLYSRGVHLSFREFVLQKAHQDPEHQNASLLLHIFHERTDDHVSCRQSWRHSATPDALTQVGGCVIRRGRQRVLPDGSARKLQVLPQVSHPSSFTSFEFQILRHPFALPLAPSEGSWEGRVR